MRTLVKPAIALPVYNRFNHTKRTLEAIRKFGRDLPLYIFSDGPVNSTDANKVREVRELLSTVEYRYAEMRKENHGLMQSITTRLTWC